MNDADVVTPLAQAALDADQTLITAVIRLDDDLNSPDGTRVMVGRSDWNELVHPLVEQLIRARACAISEAFDSVRARAGELVDISAEFSEAVELRGDRLGRALDCVSAIAACVTALTVWRRAR